MQAVIMAVELASEEDDPMSVQVDRETLGQIQKLQRKLTLYQKLLGFSKERTMGSEPEDWDDVYEVDTYF